MEQELQQLRQAMESRPAIDMARGVLVKVFRCPREEAWRIMVRVSQNSNVKVRNVAEVLLETVQGEPFPDDLRPHLVAAVQAVCDLDASGMNGSTVDGRRVGGGGWSGMR
ncbi:ANTAR domain-containing protein [Streptomyces sp. NPDC087263]|uniref:ANTAR domain-containing protein n=1 Tax=Streptomyces sp. NPDC087263 TaxID=3365773 RepID=UPI00382265F9